MAAQHLELLFLMMTIVDDGGGVHFGHVEHHVDLSGIDVPTFHELLERLLEIALDFLEKVKGREGVLGDVFLTVQKGQQHRGLGQQAKGQAKASGSHDVLIHFCKALQDQGHGGFDLGQDACGEAGLSLASFHDDGLEGVEELGKVGRLHRHG